MVVSENRNSSERHRRCIILLLSALLMFAQAGGPLHHHVNKSDSDSCAVCHAPAPVPVLNLIGGLFARLIPMDTVEAAIPSAAPPPRQKRPSTPRAPPSWTSPANFPERPARLAA